MSEYNFSKRAIRTSLVGIISLAVAGCGSSKSTHCEGFSKQVAPAEILPIETGTTSEGTYVYILLNNMGSISVRQTLQSDPKDVNLSQAPLQVSTVATSIKSSLEFKESDGTETITVSPHEFPDSAPVTIHSEFCATS
jgi:hypothetical protein